MPSEMAYRTAFGSWGNALRQCGYEPLKSRPSKKCIGNSVKAHKGKRSFAWKGGRRINEHGYIEIWCPQHQNANKKGYILEHRYIMSQIIGRPLLDIEDVHHINGVKTDNRPENLKLMLKNEHTKYHEELNPQKHTRKNLVRCKFPDCNNNTSSKYGLCCKHYKLQWQRKKNKLIDDLLDFKEITKKHSEETKRKLSELARKQKRKENGKFEK